MLSPGLAVLVFGLTGLAHGFPAWQVIAAVALGLGMLAGFVVHGIRTKGTPLAAPRLFTRPPFGVAALALLALGASVSGTVLVTRVIDRTAPRTLVLGAMALTQLGRAVPDAVIVDSLFLRGAGAAMISTPVMTIVYRRVGRALIPRAAVALNLLGTLGGSLGTAVVAVLLQAAGPDQAAAFGDAFWWVLGLVALAALAATALPSHDQEREAADA